MATPPRSERAPSAARALEMRAARAGRLGSASTSDAEPLQFAAGLLRAQAAAADALANTDRDRGLTGTLSTDLASILEPVAAVLRFVERDGPAPVAAAARTRASEDDRTAGERLLLYWSGDRTSADDYLSRAMLRPYVETLRALDRIPVRARVRGRCPFCGGAAGLGRRRGGESQGAVRSLLCALCGLEWEFQRIRCPACFEDEPQRLPSFTGEPHPRVSIEACETCGRYLKSFDTTLDEEVLPEVDDLASLSLDLWAREQGLERIEPGLAGL